MKSETELSMILSSSFHLDKTIGDWQNSIPYKDETGETRDSFSITYLLDYQHLYFHLGISIKQLRGDFSQEIIKIWEKIRYYSSNISKKELNGIPLRFTGLVFLITNECSIDKNEIKSVFEKHRLFLTIYELKSDRLEIVSEVTKFDSSIFFENDIIELQKKVAVNRPGYVIWEHESGMISYSFHMQFNLNEEVKNKCLKNLSEITVLKQETIDLLNTKKLRKNNNHILIEAMTEAFEDNVEKAKDLLINFNDKIRKKLLIRNIVLSIIPFCISGLIFLIVEELWSPLNPEYIYVGFLGVIGSLLSILMKRSFFIKLEKLKPIEVIVEAFIKALIGFLSGVIINLAINLNLILGIAERIESKLLIGFLAGWSERFFPNIIGKIENTVDSTKSA